MISFRDMTFCPYWDSCANGETCPKALTEAVKTAAIKWWGGDEAPICEYSSEPLCFKEIVS